MRRLILLLAALSLSAPAADRAAWMRDARWGVMTHYLADWIARAAGEPMTVEKWNALVGGFDVEALAGQLQSVGAGYYLITIGQNSGYYLAPNATYERYTKTGKCSRRDLVADLSAALSKRGIRLMVYLPAGAPAGDPAAIKALEWRNGPYRNREFQLKWEQVIREWSTRWGTKISGWWFDGCYWSNTMYRTSEPPDFATFAGAARAGNPASVLAFNPGVVYRMLSVTPHEDYVAGEIDQPERATIRRAQDGKIDGAQLHMLSYLGKTWGMGEPRFTAEEAANWSLKITEAGGVVTWDTPIQRNGTFSQPFLDRLAAIGKTMRPATSEFRARLLAATTKHLDLLLDQNGKVAALKGKSTDAMTASAFYTLYEQTGNAKYRAAAVELAGRIVDAMKAMKFGVLYIKEKDKGEGKVIPGGGPPAFGWYTATAAWILRRERGREADLKYIAGVLDRFPWNEEGWWSADIDVKTGESKQPLSKPSPINKNAAMAMAAARVGAYIKDLDPALSARLIGKAEKCLYRQILPAQQPDGFWHYGLTGNDPRNKDILGYFMVTMDGLIQLQQYGGLPARPEFRSALDKANDFAVRCIAPMTEPHRGPGCASRTTPATPTHYSAADDTKRGFQLGTILTASGNFEQAIPIMDETLKHFPYGDTGSEGAHAVHPCALMLRLSSARESRAPR